MFRCLLNQGNQDQTHEVFWYAVLFHYGFDLVHESNCDQGYQSQRNRESNDAFGKRELGFSQIPFSISVLCLVGRKYFVENTVVAFGIVPDESMLRSVLVQQSTEHGLQ